MIEHSGGQRGPRRARSGSYADQALPLARRLAVIPFHGVYKGISAGRKEQQPQGSGKRRRYYGKPFFHAYHSLIDHHKGDVD
jgi:hypothetical protein